MTFRGYCTSNRAGATTTSNTVILTFPAGTAAGDAAVIVSSLNASSGTATAKAGANTWTVSGGPDNNQNVLLTYMWARVLTASDVAAGSVTITWSASGRVNGTGDVFTNVDPVNTFGTPAYSSNTSSTVIVPPIVTDVDNADIAVVTATRVASGTAALVTLPAVWTKDGNSSTAFGSGVNFNSVSGHLTTPSPAGSYGGGTITTSPAATNMIAYTIMVRPAPVVSAAFSGSVALSGSGSLSTSGQVSVPGTVSTSGSGALSLYGSPSSVGSVSLSASGLAADTGKPGLTATLARTGLGSQIGLGSPGVNGVTVLFGSGTLSDSGVYAPGSDFTGSLALSGNSTLSLTARVAFTGSRLLTGTGTETESGSPAFTGSRLLTGTGSQLRTAQPSFAGQIDSTGDSALTLDISPGLAGSLQRSAVGFQTRRSTIVRDVTITVGTPVLEWDATVQQFVWTADVAFDWAADLDSFDWDSTLSAFEWEALGGSFEWASDAPIMTWNAGLPDFD